MDNTDSARQLAASALGWMPGAPVTSGRRGRERRAAASLRRFLHPGEHGNGGSAAPERWRLIVEGRVQGVGYRAACCAQAHNLGLGGWVRNLPDGRVEVQAEGSAQQLSKLRLWCEIGPPRAHVRGVATVPVGATGQDWFEVRP